RALNVVVDSSGWVEFFVDGPNAEWFARAIQDASELIVPSICVFEVYRYVLRQRGRHDALQAAATMRQGRVADLDEGLAIEAAELGASLRLPLADSVIYATALAAGAELWTQDADFEGLESVKFRAKRNASS
ncbi:MAG: type II toxin-antitoxin system VapC family toxin, partial [Longimicrobiales bacterium]